MLQVRQGEMLVPFVFLRVPSWILFYPLSRFRLRAALDHQKSWEPAPGGGVLPVSHHGDIAYCLPGARAPAGGGGRKNAISFHCRFAGIDAEHLGGRPARKRPERANSDIDGVVKTAAHGAPDIVDERPPGFVTDIVGDFVKLAGNNVLSERFGRGHRKHCICIRSLWRRRTNSPGVDVERITIHRAGSLVISSRVPGSAC